MSQNFNVMSDEDLVHRAKEDDNEAFSELINRHFGRIFSIAYARLQNPDSAEDLSQEVFLRAWINLKGLRNPAHFSHWLARMARNLSVTWLRQKTSRSKLVRMVPMEDSIAEIPDQHQENVRDQLNRAHTSQLLRKAVAELPPKDQELIFMHFDQSLSLREISKTTGIHHTTVGRKISKICETLKSSIGRDEVELKSLLPDATKARFHSMALVASFAALSESQRSVVIQAANETAKTLGTGAEEALSPISGGFISNLFNHLTTGVTAMNTAQKVTAAGAIIALGAGTLYFTHVTHSEVGSNNTSAFFEDPDGVFPIRQVSGIWNSPFQITVSQQETVEIVFPENELGIESMYYTLSTEGLQYARTYTNGHRESYGIGIGADGKSFSMYTSYPPEGVALVDIRGFEVMGNQVRINLEQIQSAELGTRMADVQNLFDRGEISRQQVRDREKQLIDNLNILPTNPEMKAAFKQQGITYYDW